MKKCEVLKDCAIAVGKGSIVFVSDVQYNIASELLKPITEEVNKEPIEEVNDKPVKEEKKNKKK